MPCAFDTHNRNRMERAGFGVGSLSERTGVPVEVVRAWVDGTTPRREEQTFALDRAIREALAEAGDTP